MSALSKAIGLAQQAMGVLAEGSKLIGELGELAESTKEAWSTQDKARLDELLLQARQKRQAAFADLEDAMKKL